MGKFDFNIPDDFIRQLGRLADVDKYAPKMIDEAIPILEGRVKAKRQNISTPEICINQLSILRRVQLRRVDTMPQ